VLFLTGVERYCSSEWTRKGHQPQDLESPGGSLELIENEIALKTPQTIVLKKVSGIYLIRFFRIRIMREVIFKIKVKFCILLLVWMHIF